MIDEVRSPVALPSGTEAQASSRGSRRLRLRIDRGELPTPPWAIATTDQARAHQRWLIVMWYPPGRSLSVIW